MAGFRHHLRAWTTAWLVCQVVALSAFAPQSCCLAHASHHGAHEGHADPAHTECADPAIPADSCPMRGATGEACPMHREQQAQVDASDPMHSGSSVISPSASEAPARGECAIRGICNGPSVAIASLFPMPAVLADAPAESIDFGVSPVMAPGLDLPRIPVSSDTPPPRA